MRGHSLAAAVIVIAAASAVAACSSSSSTGSGGGEGSKSYTVAIVADETGALAGTYGSAPAGLQTYLDQLNASGGVNGHKISLDVLDAKSDPNSALTAFRQAMSDNPTVIVHAGVSSELSSAQSLMSSAGIPVLSDSTLDTLLVPEPAPWFFNIYPTASQFAASQILQIQKAAGGSLKGKKIAIVEGVSSSLDEQLAFVENQYAKQLGYSYTITKITNGITAFPQASQIASSHPAGVDLLTIGNDTATIVKALTSAGLNVPMVSNTTGASDAFLTQVGLGNYYGLEPAPTPRAGSPLTALAEKYGQAPAANNPSFSLGYTDGYLIERALTQCGSSCDASGVIKGFESISNATVPDGAMYGPVSFSSTNHVGMNAVAFSTYDTSTKAVVQADVITLPPVLTSDPGA
jgi:branched-chain amino acid transport system substrate-binding protein